MQRKLLWLLLMSLLVIGVYGSVLSSALGRDATFVTVATPRIKHVNGGFGYFQQLGGTGAKRRQLAARPTPQWGVRSYSVGVGAYNFGNYAGGRPSYGQSKRLIPKFSKLQTRMG